MEKLKPGEFVEYFPEDSNQCSLPDSATSAPAVVVKVTDEGVHLNVFTADFTGANPVKQAFNVQHKKEVKSGTHHWDYLD